jgi:hypothetical protein
VGGGILNRGARRTRRRITGITRSARMARAARFGRSLSLPPLSAALCLEQSFSSSSSFSFSILLRLLSCPRVMFPLIPFDETQKR